MSELSLSISVFENVMLIKWPNRCGAIMCKCVFRAAARASLSSSLPTNALIGTTARIHCEEKCTYEWETRAIKSSLLALSTLERVQGYPQNFPMKRNGALTQDETHNQLSVFLLSFFSIHFEELIFFTFSCKLDYCFGQSKAGKHIRLND